MLAKISFLLFLFSFSAQSQIYRFETIEYRMPDLSWRTEKTTGIIVKNKDYITIDTGEYLKYYVVQSIESLAKDDIIYKCDKKITIRFNNGNMYYYSDGEYRRYKITKL